MPFFKMFDDIQRENAQSSKSWLKTFLVSLIYHPNILKPLCFENESWGELLTLFKSMCEIRQAYKV